MSRKAYLLTSKTSERVSRMLKQHENMTVTGGRRTLSEENSHLVVEGGEGGEGLPEGYVETSVILCQNGQPVNGTILFKEDE